MDPSAPRHCPACGSPLTTREIEARQRAYCSACERPVYRNPKPCAGVLVVDDDSVLLVKRTNPPAGVWSLPAGFLEHDEAPETGAVRELEEETGVTVNEDDVELFDTAFIPRSERANVLVVIYRVVREATSGTPTPGSDAAATRFWNPDALADSEEGVESGYGDVFRRALTE